MDNKKLENILSDIKDYQKIDVVADAITAKATRETAGPDDEKQRELLTQIRDHLATIVKGLFGSATGGNTGSSFLGRGPNNTPLLPGPAGKQQTATKSRSPFANDAIEFFSGMKQGYAEMLQYFSSEKKSEDIKAMAEKTGADKTSTSDKNTVPESRTVIEVLESIDSRLAKMQLFSKNKSDVIDVDLNKQGELPGIEPQKNTSSFSFEMLPDITDAVQQLEREVEQSTLDPDKQKALANELGKIEKKLNYKPRKATVGKKITTPNFPAGITTKSGTVMADVPTFLRRKKGMGSLELSDVGVQSSPDLVTSGNPVPLLKTISSDTNDTKDILTEIKEELQDINESTFSLNNVSSGLLSTLGVSAGILAGGAAASFGAAGILATPAAEGLRKSTAGNSMLGAMSGDTAMAGAILDANGPDTAEQVRERQLQKKQALKDSPWYTRIYGVGEEKYLKEQGYTQDQIDEMRGKNSMADLEAQKLEMETTLGSRKWMDPEDQKKYDDINKKLEGKKARLSAADMTTSGIELNNESSENKQLVSGNNTPIQQAPLINNVVSNNNTQSFVPIKPTPRASDSPFERFQDRLIKG